MLVCPSSQHYYATFKLFDILFVPFQLQLQTSYLLIIVFTVSIPILELFLYPICSSLFLSDDSLLHSDHCLFVLF